MKTKKQYMAPSVEVAEIEPMSILSASQITDPTGQPDPFLMYDSQPTSVVAPSDWDLWKDIDETNGYIE